MENRSDHITRREVAAAIVSAACRAVFDAARQKRRSPVRAAVPEPAAPAKPADRFDALAALLERQFTVHEVQMRPQTVVVAWTCMWKRRDGFSAAFRTGAADRPELIGGSHISRGPTPGRQAVAAPAEVFRLDPADPVPGGGAGAEGCLFPAQESGSFRDPRASKRSASSERLYARTACAAIVEDRYSLLPKRPGAQYIAVSSADGRYEPHAPDDGGTRLARYFLTHPRLITEAQPGDEIRRRGDRRPDDARNIGEMAGSSGSG